MSDLQTEALEVMVNLLEVEMSALNSPAASTDSSDWLERIKRIVAIIKLIMDLFKPASTAA